MRITAQVLKKHSSSPLEEVEYLDLSGKEIAAIERLGPCRRLQTLVLCGNTIDAIRNLDCCRQLWKIDLTGNRALLAKREGVGGEGSLVGRAWVSGRETSSSLSFLLERLGPCRRLQTLVLCGNTIDAIRNLDCCRQLWKIDLTGNRVKSLHGLSRFPVLGSLALGHNDLEWQELRRLSHLHLLSLTLVGNSKLDSDPHYRKHVVDLLPHLWVLDGRIITADEKKEVARFFVKTETSSQPVRRKAAESSFVPTCRKNLLVTGVFGEKTTHLMARFPVNYVHNIEMDCRRLQYLAYSFGEDMKLESRYRKWGPERPPLPELEELIGHRGEEVEQSNMLLLLLLANLEFNLPIDVMKSTLETAKLTRIGDIDCVDMFSLPDHMVLDLASLLLSAAAVDREGKKEGGLYDDLFQSLCHAMENLQRKRHGHRARRNEGRAKKLGAEKKECLLASEVVHLMCLVPLFFESLESDAGLMEMVAVATKNPYVSDVVSSITWKVQQRGGDVWEVYHDIASYLLRSTSENVLRRRRRQLRLRKHSASIPRTSSQLIQSTQPKSHFHALRALSAGAVRPQRGLATRSAQVRTQKTPELGDLVLINPESMARIVALPETSVAVLQLNPSSSSPPDSYFYTDTRGLVWEKQLDCWTKDNLEADLSTGRLTEHLSTSTLPTYPSASSLEAFTITPHSAPPEPLTHTHPHSHPHLPPRPHSQLSFTSEDLQPIISEEELMMEDSVSQQPPMRVDISDRPPGSMRVLVTPLTDGEIGEAQAEHKRHVLHQYNVSQPDNKTETAAEELGKKPSPCSSPSPEPLPPSPREHHRESFRVPTPQLHVPSTWESAKSLPTSAYTKPHSCHQSEKQITKLNSYPSPHSSPSSPPHPVPSTSPTLTSTISSLSLKSSSFSSHTHLPQTVVYDAWSTVKPNSQTRHTLLTSSRRMNKRQPRTPPLTRNSSGAYASSGMDDGGSRASIILRDKQPPSHHRSVTPPRMMAYAAHSNPGRYHYQAKRHKKTPSTRRLGDIKGLCVGGTSIL